MDFRAGRSAVGGDVDAATIGVKGAVAVVVALFEFHKTALELELSACEDGTSGEDALPPCSVCGEDGK